MEQGPRDAFYFAYLLHFHLFSPLKLFAVGIKMVPSQKTELVLKVHPHFPFQPPTAMNFIWTDNFIFFLTSRTISILTEGDSSSVGSCSDSSRPWESFVNIKNPSQYTGPTPSMSAPVSWGWSTTSGLSPHLFSPGQSLPVLTPQQCCIRCWLVSFHARPQIMLPSWS